MARLKDYIELTRNDEHCAVLTVKADSELALSSLGFYGNEQTIKVTKGEQRDCTISYKDGTQVYFTFGKYRRTIICNQLEKIKRLVEECLMMDFDINMIKNISSTLYVKNYNSSIGKLQNFKLICTHKSQPTTVHRDGVYLATFKNYEEAENYIYKILEDIDDKGFESSKYSEVRLFSGIRKKAS